MACDVIRKSRCDYKTLLHLEGYERAWRGFSWSDAEKELRGSPGNRRLNIAALGNIAPEVDLDTIDPAKDLRNQIDIDSVDFLNFVIALHQKLGVEIPDAEAAKLTTLHGCVAYLTDKVGAAQE